MRAFTTTTAALAVFSVIQFCPAPPAVIASIAGGILGGAVSGGISAGTHNRRDLPPGVSQQSVNQCIQQINSQGTPVKVYSTGTDSARADNVPPACMDLATVLLSNPAQAGGPVPVPMGSASLEYHGLTDQDKHDLQAALSG